MTHCFPELVETEIGARRFANSPLHSPPRIDAADTSTKGARFERLLVPVDLSTGSLSVLRRVGALA